MVVVVDRRASYLVQLVEQLCGACRLPSAGAEATSTVLRFLTLHALFNAQGGASSKVLVSSEEQAILCSLILSALCRIALMVECACSPASHPIAAEGCARGTAGGICGAAGDARSARPVRQPPAVAVE